MARRILSRITPSSVIATIALFAALGGGYAIAFSGSGSLQKGAVLGFPGDGSFTPVRSLTGIGKIEAKCTDSTGNMVVGFHNSSGKPLTVDTLASVEGSGAFPRSDTLDTGENSDHVISGLGGNDTLIQMHIAPDSGVKSPQANVTIQAENATACFNSRVAVLALNTQQP